MQVPELVSQVDLTPTLLQGAGFEPPRPMQGRAFLSLLDRHIQAWRNEVYLKCRSS